MKLARLALALLVGLLVAALAGCASPADNSASFAAWASGQKFVASVDAHPRSGTMGPYGMSAHLVVDAAIAADELEALASAAWDKAAELGITSSEINLIVGNAWGFSVDDAGTHVAMINQLRDDPAFVGATVEYQPLDYTPGYSGGVRGTVGSQAALRGANDVLIAAVLDNGGDLDGVTIGASTADGAFGIIGEGDVQPLTAIQLWQAISARVQLLTAQATLPHSGPERLEITVGSAADQAVAEAIGSEHPDVKLTVGL